MMEPRGTVKVEGETGAKAQQVKGATANHAALVDPLISWLREADGLQVAVKAGRAPTQPMTFNASASGWFRAPAILLGRPSSSTAAVSGAAPRTKSTANVA